MPIQVIRRALRGIVASGGLQRAARIARKALLAGVDVATALGEVFPDLSRPGLQSLLMQALEGTRAALSMRAGGTRTLIGDNLVPVFEGFMSEAAPGSRIVVDVIVENPLGGEDIYLRIPVTDDMSEGEIADLARQRAAGPVADSPGRYQREVDAHLMDEAAVARELQSASVRFIFAGRSN